MTGYDVELVLRGMPDLIQRYTEFTLNQYLDTTPEVIRCPKPRCNFPMIKETSNPMVCCRNPSCNFSYCSNCRVEWHADTTCERYQEWLKDNAGAEDAYLRWRAANTKPCPKCKADIEKNGGVSRMATNHVPSVTT